MGKRFFVRFQFECFFSISRIWRFFLNVFSEAFENWRLQYSWVFFFIYPKLLFFFLTFFLLFFLIFFLTQNLKNWRYFLTFFCSLVCRLNKMKGGKKRREKKGRLQKRPSEKKGALSKVKLVAEVRRKKRAPKKKKGEKKRAIEKNAKK